MFLLSGNERAGISAARRDGATMSFLHPANGEVFACGTVRTTPDALRNLRPAISGQQPRKATEQESRLVSISEAGARKRRRLCAGIGVRARATGK